MCLCRMSSLGREDESDAGSGESYIFITMEHNFSSTSSQIFFKKKKKLIKMQKPMV